MGKDTLIKGINMTKDAKYISKSNISFRTLILKFFKRVIVNNNIIPAKKKYNSRDNVNIPNHNKSVILSLFLVKPCSLFFIRRANIKSTPTIRTVTEKGDSINSLAFINEKILKRIKGNDTFSSNLNEDNKAVTKEVRT